MNLTFTFFLIGLAELIEADRQAELAKLIEAHREAEREADYWNRRCALWTKAHGIAVWRESHPLDREKLRQRRYWRQRARQWTSS
jgi:hypothetical protein